MKVYARFIHENDNVFRTNTLLCFKDSAKLLGSVVMFNPGSASATDDNVDKNILNSFYKNTANLDEFVSVRSDSTMRQIVKIFNGSYVDEEKELNGIIQIFNLFSLKGEKPNVAYDRAYELKSQYLFCDEFSFRDAPVLYAFGKNLLPSINDDSKFAKTILQRAQNAFDSCPKQYKNIYKNDFFDNDFYHPMYINRAYKQEKVQKFLKDFYDNLCK